MEHNYKKQFLLALLSLSVGLFTGNAIAMDLVGELDAALVDKIDFLDGELDRVDDKLDDLTSIDISALSDTEAENKNPQCFISEEITIYEQKHSEIIEDIDELLSLLSFQPSE